MCDFEQELEYPLESQAPLANVQLPSAQGLGLTLEDLEQWHAGEEPELQLSEILADEELSSAHSFSASPSVVRVKKTIQNVDKPQNKTLSEALPSNTLEDLKALFALSIENHHYALNKREDMKRISKQSDLLFQKLPQYLDRLIQVLHAHEQNQILYARLAELSEKKGSAALIIQTARQVEVLEKNLKEKRFRAEELKKMQMDLKAHLILVERYQAVFQQVNDLAMLNID